MLYGDDVVDDDDDDYNDDDNHDVVVVDDVFNGSTNTYSYFYTHQCMYMCKCIRVCAHAL